MDVLSLGHTPAMPLRDYEQRKQPTWYQNAMLHNRDQIIRPSFTDA